MSGFHIPWDMIATIVCSVLASSGFWAAVMRWADRKNAKTKLLLGLAHDRIVSIGQAYIGRGWITAEEYDDLYTYLYLPYKKEGGNGTAERIMKEVASLPVKKDRAAI